MGLGSEDTAFGHSKKGLPGFWGFEAMPPPKGGNAVNAVLAKFRKDQAKSVAVVAEAAKEREEKLKKVAAGGK